MPTLLLEEGGGDENREEEEKEEEEDIRERTTTTGQRLCRSRGYGKIKKSGAAAERGEGGGG